MNHRQYRFQNGLETGSRARIKSTQTVQEARVRVARELQLPMLYWPILWKFGGKELTDLLTLACM